MRSLPVILFILLSAVSFVSAEAPSSRNTIQPILTRYGCEMGACHGADAGDGLFDHAYFDKKC